VQLFGLAGLQMPLLLQLPLAPEASTGHVLLSFGVHVCTQTWKFDCMKNWHCPESHCVFDVHGS
jgi:hypothetical protein